MSSTKFFYQNVINEPGEGLNRLERRFKWRGDGGRRPTANQQGKAQPKQPERNGRAMKESDWNAKQGGEDMEKEKEKEKEKEEERVYME